ncbi:MAG: zf-HC2 domain-containing protein [Acidimicrobiia bacterium]|nr:zf-HC2 domain-containing protein [Acidimicrobiia bacterium]
MSGCEHAIEYVYQYLDEEISFFRKSRVRVHLRRCPPCMDAFQFEDKLKGVIRDRGRSDPPPELFDTLRALLQEERQRDEPGI